MQRAAWILACILATAVAATGEEMTRSLRPLPRPEAQAAVAAPKPALAGAMSVSLRPRPRPSETAIVAEKTAKKPEKASKKGSVCGVAAIKGEEIATIKGKVKGCGLKEGVRVTSVSGVKLVPAPTIDCATAKALNHWVEAVVQPAYKRDVAEIRIAAHYICRTRNNKKGAKISEHGRGKAVDIAAFVLNSGKVLSVAGGFNKTMRKVHKGACGIFGTTLGPGSDGYHEDHLHFDTASHRSGAYCR